MDKSLVSCFLLTHGVECRGPRTSLRKHDVIKLCSIEYLTTQIELALPTFKSWTVHKIIEYLTLVAYFFDTPCILAMYPVSPKRPPFYFLNNSVKN